jgi:hypothetical protein
MQFAVSDMVQLHGPYQLYFVCKCFKSKKFSGMAAKRKRTMEDTGIAHRKTTQYTVSIWCTCNPQFYRESQQVKTEQSSHYQQRFDPPSIFKLYFLKIIHLLVEETNRYYQQYFNTLDKGQFPLPDATIQKTYFFLPLLCRWAMTKRTF